MKRVVSIIVACVTWALLGTKPAHAIPEAGYAERFEREVLPFCLDQWKYGHFSGVGNVTLSYASYQVTRPRGALVIVPGRSEPFLSFCELVYDLKDSGYDFYLLDHRGQGWSERLLSDPHKGYVEQFTHYVRDLHTFVDRIVKPARYARVVGLGHSMGGAVVTADAELYPQDFASLILSAPMHAVNTKQYPPLVAYFIAGGAHLFNHGTDYAPGQAPPDPYEPFSSNDQTHSELRWAMARKLWQDFPELMVGGATFRWLKEALEGSAAIRLGAFKLRQPILLFQVEHETYVDNSGQDEVCRKAAHCKKLFVPGAFHSLLLERDAIRDIALAAIREVLSLN